MQYSYFKHLLLSVLLILLIGCISPTHLSSKSLLGQYRWVMQEFSHPDNLSIKNKQHIVRLDFDKQNIIIAPGCNRFTGAFSTTNNIISFDDLSSTKVRCRQSSMEWDQFLVKEINNAKITKIGTDYLILQSQNNYRIVFKSLPKIDTKGVTAHLWDISPKMINCNIDTIKQCLRIKKSPISEWEILDENIEGFVFKEGQSYRIRVLETRNKNQQRYYFDTIISQALVGTRQP